MRTPIDCANESELYALLTDEADILLTDDYGYLTEECTMLEDSTPAIVSLAKYDNTYIVWVDDEYPSFSDGMLFHKCEFFPKYEDAEQCFNSLKNAGIPPISRQIEVCVNHTSDPKRVKIIGKQRTGIHTYDVYYEGNILIEHMRELDANIINTAIRKYELFEKQYNIEVRSIEKKTNRSTNQSAYVLKTVDSGGAMHEIEAHISSVLEGQQRCALDIVTQKITLKTKETITMKTTGTVKWFNKDKGYGFIQTNEGADVFMHYSNIIMEGFRYLEPGDIVEYSAEVNEKGTYAVEVIPVLTVKMMREKARKDHMHLELFKDAYGIQKWLVVDEGGIIQSSEQGMTLEELNEYFS